MTDRPRLDELLHTHDGDAGCAAGGSILDEYVEIELAGGDPGERFPGTMLHLRVCHACRADHDGLLEAATRFGDVAPE
jgi:hypothetical protein